MYDPFASFLDVKNKYKTNLISFSKINKKAYNFIIIAVGHSEFINLKLNKYAKNKETIIFDLKNLFNNDNYLKL